MILVLSPAKSLDEQRAWPASVTPTRPEFLAAAATLVRHAKALDAADLQRLMSISPALAALNVERFRRWTKPHRADNARVAAAVFDGDVYTGLDASTWRAAEYRWAQAHIRILSGLYGVLRPLDLIKPYRLEMGVRWRTDAFDGLCDFWGARPTKAIARDLATHPDATLVNLASDEYFGVIRPDRLPGAVIKPVFREKRGTSYQVISFAAKKARGLMARYAVEHRLKSPAGLRAFDVDGYRFDAQRSSEREWVFLRD
ncbi:MAG: peroxide stress protein YaaA [Phycisphaerales bacterium]|nr:peroxide stress protein YaaA [Phycisphaerales bacterium]